MTSTLAVATILLGLSAMYVLWPLIWPSGPIMAVRARERRDGEEG